MLTRMAWKAKHFLLGFIVQTPRDNMPFCSFAVTGKNDADWVCLFFAGPDIDFETLLCRDEFPSDYTPPLSPDFMILPACLLRWQVEQTREGLANLTDVIMDTDKILTYGSPSDLGSIRSKLFQLGKEHLMLHRRWLFEQELAANLTRCFEIIEKRTNQDQPAKYSKTLRQKVQIQENLSRTLQHDLDTTPWKIRAQHTMVASTTSL